MKKRFRVFAYLAETFTPITKEVLSMAEDAASSINYTCGSSLVTAWVHLTNNRLFPKNLHVDSLEY